MAYLRTTMSSSVSETLPYPYQITFSRLERTVGLPAARRQVRNGYLVNKQMTGFLCLTEPKMSTKESIGKETAKNKKQENRHDNDCKGEDDYFPTLPSLSVQPERLMRIHWPLRLLSLCLRRPFFLLPRSKKMNAHASVSRLHGHGSPCCDPSLHFAVVPPKHMLLAARSVPWGLRPNLIPLPDWHLTIPAVERASLLLRLCPSHRICHPRALTIPRA